MSDLRKLLFEGVLEPELIELLGNFSDIGKSFHSHQSQVMMMKSLAMETKVTKKIWTLLPLFRKSMKFCLFFIKLRNGRSQSDASESQESSEPKVKSDEDKEPKDHYEKGDFEVSMSEDEEEKQGARKQGSDEEESDSSDDSESEATSKNQMTPHKKDQ